MKAMKSQLAIHIYTYIIYIYMSNTDKNFKEASQKRDIFNS